MIKINCLSSNSMIKQFCETLKIDCEVNEDADLCEYYIKGYDFNSQPELFSKLLSKIDWEFISKNNKKLIFTHLIIYHLAKFEEVLTYYIEKYNCQDKVFWYSFNPYELTFKRLNKKINIAYFDPLNHIHMEANLHIGKWSYFQGSELKSFNEADKYFISTNHRHATHRVLSNHLLNTKKLIKKGYYSFYPPENNIYHNKQQLIIDFEKNLESINNYKLDINKICDDMNFTHLLDKSVASHFGLYPSTAKFYERSLVSHVTESSVSNTEIFLTEKTYLPLLLGRPFLLIGNKDSLKFLKKYYGFKTFDKIFDESYDNEKCFIKRTMKVTNELDKFCSLPFSVAKEKVESISHILLHNRKVCESFNPAYLFRKMIMKITEG